MQWIHCSLFREPLAVKGLNECLKKTFDNVMKMINFLNYDLKTQDYLVFFVMKWAVKTNNTVKLGGCRVVKCYHYLNSGMNLECFYWGTIEMQNP